MDHHKGNLYNAKVLLFGEYGIIEDAMGLSIPYDYYKGSLKFAAQDQTKAAESNRSLLRFSVYLRAYADELCLDVATLEKELAQGMYFDSSIPNGYGVGSSGAIVAAVYHRYCRRLIAAENISKKDLLALKKIFSLMESYFHGRSSGLDPLICYLNLPLLIRSKSELDMISMPQSDKQGRGAIFLLDSGHSGKTGEMVSLFFEKMKSEGFSRMLREEFIEYNNACIRSFLAGEKAGLFSNIKKLSRFVYENLSQMIPSGLEMPWLDGLDRGVYYLKLCGSGGGGFVLGFTADLEKSRQMLTPYHLEVIYKF